MIISLHHDEITSYFEKINNRKPLANQYNRKKKTFPAKSRDWEKILKDNKNVGLDFTFCSNSNKNIQINVFLNIKSLHSFKTKEKCNLLAKVLEDQ